MGYPGGEDEQPAGRPRRRATRRAAPPRPRPSGYAEPDDGGDGYRPPRDGSDGGFADDLPPRAGRVSRPGGSWPGQDPGRPASSADVRPRHGSLGENGEDRGRPADGDSGARSAGEAGRRGPRPGPRRPALPGAPGAPGRSEFPSGEQAAIGDGRRFSSPGMLGGLRPGPLAPPGAGRPELPAPAGPMGAPGGGDGRRGPRGPIRGFPPNPGQPDPVYPPGEFSLWNRPSVRMAWLGVDPSEGVAADREAGPGYAHLAVSDPSADATSTQTWAAIEDTGGWRTEQPGRRAAAQSDHGAYPNARAQAVHAVGPGPGPGPGPRISEPPVGAMGPRLDSRPGAGGDGDATPGADGAPEAAVRAGRPARRGKPAGQFGGAAGRRAFAAAAQEAGPRARAPKGKTSRATVPAVRSNKPLAVLLGAPVAIVIVVVTVYVAMQSGSPLATRVAPPAATRTESSPAASLGPWRHIGVRADDPRPLTLAELFPAKFSLAGVAGTRTADKADTKCTRDVVGGKLRSAVRKASCTQAMRASYLSTNRKMMATVGVLNLLSATDAEKVGKATGATEFIRQLPGSHGPTKKLAQGTGLEEAEVKGHYLILIWAEFANLRAPSGKHQRAELEQFSSGLINGTVNTSLSSRMVTGQPIAAP